jgi:hypothetical protein
MVPHHSNHVWPFNIQQHGWFREPRLIGRRRAAATLVSGGARVEPEAGLPVEHR